MREPVKPKRAYRSTQRRAQAEQTRRRMLDAARDRFIEQGYGGTTIAAVASVAGVAPETVYAAFGSKPALLAELVRAAARGQDPRPILEQAGPAAVAAADGQPEQLRRFASDVCDRLERVGPLMAVVAAAAPSQPELATLYRELHQARLRNLRQFIDLLAANGPLRMAPKQAAETVWALASPEMHQLLRRTRGWSRAAYEAWLAAGLAALLLP
jgi:AcrR family transcriptional regulator